MPGISKIKQWCVSPFLFAKIIQVACHITPLSTIIEWFSPTLLRSRVRNGGKWPAVCLGVCVERLPGTDCTECLTQNQNQAARNGKTDRELRATICYPVFLQERQVLM